MSVVCTALSPTHVFSETPTSTLSTSSFRTAVPSPGILLITHYGVLNDCHAGPTMQHVAKIRKNASPVPNIRQVHLQSEEILEELGIDPAAVGENITTSGLNLYELGEDYLVRFEEVDEPDGSRRRKPSFDGVEIGSDLAEEMKELVAADAKRQGAVVRVTGLRNPCFQIDKCRPGLKEKFFIRDENRKIIGPKAGVMSVVERGGWVRAGMKIVVEKTDGEKKELPVV